MSNLKKSRNTKASSEAFLIQKYDPVQESLETSPRLADRKALSNKENSKVFRAAAISFGWEF